MKLRAGLNNWIAQNKIVLAAALSFFLVGFFAGIYSVGGVPDGTAADLTAYMEDYLCSGAGLKKSVWDVLLTVTLDNLKYFALIFVFGLTPFLCPVSIVTAAAKGFVFGFCFWLGMSSGGSGALLAVLILLPQIIYMGFLITCGAGTALDWSVRRAKAMIKRQKLYNDGRQYFKTAALITAASLMHSAFCAFLVPLITGLINPG